MSRIQTSRRCPPGGERFTTRQPGRLAVAVFLAVISGWGCDAPHRHDAATRSSDAEPGAMDTNTAAAITLQLNWFPEAEHGGFYAAQVHGYYQQEGLEVRLVPGGPNVPVVQTLDSGRADFAVTNADRVVLGRAADADIVAVMASMQNSPRCIMVHRQAGIASLEDLKNVTLAVGSGPVFYKYLALKLPLPGVQTVAYPGSIGPFLANTRYAQQAYVFSEPFLARKEGADPVALMVSELGFNPYASLLVTRGGTIRQRPAVVERMVRASLQGWRRYLSDPQATNARIDQLNADMDPEVLAFGAAEIAKLCEVQGDRAVPLGTMDATRWETLVAQMEQIALVEPGQVAPKDLYTTKFLAPP